ncbi:MAG: prephenate dehydrogenase/arogenate dehydrogenase family protein [Cyanobacteria bacterium SIG28]|nr:prephenate dehydrogenase/arogenate dehydrogenase family protein [Cyanobacteria bacterium SIG28]
MKIGVIGLGLIGGSIFKCLKDKHQVVGISRTLEMENVSSDYESLKDCNLVFVCSPMNATLEVLDKLNTILPKETVVTDVCSLKDFVSKKKYSFNFIPSHPMAGTENSGWEHSFAELFNGATWAITPIEGVNEGVNQGVNQGVEILKSVIIQLGAKPLITTAVEHDKAVAMISHFPLVVAQALCETVKDNELAQALASSGFKDTTRLALSNLEMAQDMVEFNKENIEIALQKFNESISKLLTQDYREIATKIKEFRKNLYS